MIIKQTYIKFEIVEKQIQYRNIFILLTIKQQCGYEDVKHN